MVSATDHHELRERTLAFAVARVGGGAAWRLGELGVLSADRGMAGRGGWFIAWVWGSDGRRVFLDLLTDHRMTDMLAERVWSDGEVEGIPTPGGWRPVSRDPEEDERLARAARQEDRRRYAELRRRGLLPPRGDGLPFAEADEHVRTAPLGPPHGTA